MTAALFEFGQQFRQNFGFWNYKDIVHDLADLRTSYARRHGLAQVDQPQTHPADQLLVIKDADDVLGAALRIVDRDAGVLAFDYAVEGFVERQIGG